MLKLGGGGGGGHHGIQAGGWECTQLEWNPKERIHIEGQVKRRAGERNPNEH